MKQRYQKLCSTMHLKLPNDLEKRELTTLSGYAKLKVGAVKTTVTTFGLHSFRYQAPHAGREHSSVRSAQGGHVDRFLSRK